MLHAVYIFTSRLILFFTENKIAGFIPRHDALVRDIAS